MIFKDAEPNEGVFYACRLWPRVHYCMGGLTVTPKAEVIDTDFNIIPGLFAAGEICGGVHGMVRLGTVSIAVWQGRRKERRGAPGLDLGSSREHERSGRYARKRHSFMPLVAETAGDPSPQPAER